MVNVSRLLKGSTGNVWFNGQLLATVKKIQAKVKGDFEDDTFCGDNATYNVYNGWSGEGTLTMQKINSDIWKLIASAYKSGIMPPIKIVTALTDVSTGQSERASIENITITEFSLVDFEAKKLIEEEFPFKFSNYNIIDTIS